MRSILLKSPSQEAQRVYLPPWSCRVGEGSRSKRKKYRENNSTFIV
jgi:hypothetical protein